jgi:hypothetical protein
MKFDFDKPIVRLIYCWIGTLIILGIATVLVQFIIVPTILYLFHGISFSFPTFNILKKALQFTIYSTVVMGTIFWIRNEVKIKEEGRRKQAEFNND